MSLQSVVACRSVKDFSDPVFVHEIGSVKTSFLLGLNPVFTYIGSLLLQENFNFNKFMAMILMVVAMVIANKKR